MASRSSREPRRQLEDLIDTHAHLNHPKLLDKLEDVLVRARSAGISNMIVVGYDLASSERAVRMAEAHEGIWAAVGVHPHDARSFTSDDLSVLRVLANSEKTVAIGETGLDFYRDLSPRRMQRDAFERQLDLAVELNLPAIVHCRDAQEDVLSILERRRQNRIVWHCFDGNAEQATRAIIAGVTLGIGGRLTYRSAGELRQVVAQIPLEHIVLETDCPYLTPEPMRGTDNEPAYLALVAEYLADERCVEDEELQRITSSAARRVFSHIET